MRLLIIRHGDPDYSIDSLTKRGWKEAEYLSERLEKLNVKDFYVSPMGRAKDTASLTLKKLPAQTSDRTDKISPPESSFQAASPRELSSDEVHRNIQGRAR